MCEDAYWLALWLGLAAILAAVIIGCTACFTYRDCRFAEYGYTKTVFPGCMEPVWVKDTEKEAR